MSLGDFYERAHPLNCVDFARQQVPLLGQLQIFGFCQPMIAYISLRPALVRMGTAIFDTLDGRRHQGHRRSYLLRGLDVSQSSD